MSCATCMTARINYWHHKVYLSKIMAQQGRPILAASMPSSVSLESSQQIVNIEHESMSHALRVHVCSGTQG